MRLVPMTRDSARVAAPMTLLRPLVQSGYGGVASKGVQTVSASVSGFSSVSASRIAVIGRQKW